MAELKVYAFASCLGGYADLAGGSESLLGMLAVVWIHTPMYPAGRISPAYQMLTEIGQRVAVLCEDEKPTPAIRKLTKLGLFQTFLERPQLRVGCMVAYPAGLRIKITQCGNFRG